MVKIVNSFARLLLTDHHLNPLWIDGLDTNLWLTDVLLDYTSNLNGNWEREIIVLGFSGREINSSPVDQSTRGTPMLSRPAIKR